MLAIFLTIIIPGLGHLYYGFKWKAFFLIALFILGTYFLPLLIFVYLYALYDIWKILETKPKPIFSKFDAWTVVAIGIIVPVSIGLLWITFVPPLLRYYRNDIAFPRSVSEEGRQLIDALDKYFNSHGAYPDKLELIVQGNPIRKRWLIDPWGRPYYYDTAETKKSYILMSSGPDGINNTTDDIILKNY
jgi:hypothetical protein